MAYRFPSRDITENDKVKQIVLEQTGVEILTNVADTIIDLKLEHRYDAVHFSYLPDRINDGGVILVVDDVPRYIVFPIRKSYELNANIVEAVYTDYTFIEEEQK